MTLEEVDALDPPVGALLPIMAEGPLDGDEGLLAARAEFGVARGLAVPATRKKEYAVSKIWHI
jgi:hypothetical protein